MSVCIVHGGACVYACFPRSYGREPSKHGSQAKRFAYRHKHLTPRMVDPDCVSVAKLGLVGGSRVG